MLVNSGSIPRPILSHPVSKAEPNYPTKEAQF